MLVTPTYCGDEFAIRGKSEYSVGGIDASREHAECDVIIDFWFVDAIGESVSVE